MRTLNEEERYRAWLYDALGGSAARMGEMIASYGSARERKRTPSRRLNRMRGRNGSTRCFALTPKRE